ncbi:ATP-binding protein [Streptacidiphilus monticola]
MSGLRRYALSNWRIRTRLIALLLLPVVAALVLGGLRIQTSLQSQQDLSKVSKLGDLAYAATALADALETERDTMAANVRNGDSQTQAVQNAQNDTIKKKLKFSYATQQLDLTQLPGRGVDVRNINSSLDLLVRVRLNAFATSEDGSIQRSVAAYDSLIQPLLQLSGDLALASANQELIQSTRALQAFAQWKENYSIVRAVISASLLQGKANKFVPSDVDYAKAANEAVARNKSEFQALYGAEKSAFLIGSWQQNNNVQATQRDMKAWLDQGAANAAVTAADWSTGESMSQMTLMASSENILVNELNTKVESLSSQARTDAIVNAAVIALVLVVAVAGAAIVARSMVRTLAKLQDTAEDVADHRLPDLVRKLSESDPQDVDVSITPIGIDTTDEIGHVARAFDKVHSQAVRLAAEQALLRGNINAMFTNLSRRSQGLIQRQLSMISELESREADPDQLAQLFKLDHLATRMRRNGENLLVLAGEDPGRRWTRPVPLVDVLRAAAEVEQYERIELASVPTADVAGRVVNDLVHLLAELLENATSFSSPQTRVRVTGHALPDGRVLIEIHDTGIGLSPDDLAEINERLANPPVVDVSVSRRMGLFVVGRLSLRHGIRIQLRPSDSGGTTALVMLPVDVTNVAERRAGGPQRAAGQGAPRPGAVPPGAGPRPGLPGQQGPGTGQFDGPRPGDTFGGQPGALPQRGQQPGLPRARARPSARASPARASSPQRQPSSGPTPRAPATPSAASPARSPSAASSPASRRAAPGPVSSTARVRATPSAASPARCPSAAASRLPAPVSSTARAPATPSAASRVRSPSAAASSPVSRRAAPPVSSPRTRRVRATPSARASPPRASSPHRRSVRGRRPARRHLRRPAGCAPQAPGAGQFDAPRPADTFGGQPQGGQFGNGAPRPAGPQGWGGADAPQHSAGDTGQFARPHFEEEPPAPRPRVADPLTDPLPRAALPGPETGGPPARRSSSRWSPTGSGPAARTACAPCRSSAVTRRQPRRQNRRVGPSRPRPGLPGRLRPRRGDRRGRPAGRRPVADQRQRRDLAPCRAGARAQRRRRHALRSAAPRAAGQPRARSGRGRRHRRARPPGVPLAGGGAGPADEPAPRHPAGPPGRHEPEPRHQPPGALTHEPDEPSGTEPQLVDHQLREQHARGVPHRGGLRRRSAALDVRGLPA